MGEKLFSKTLSFHPSAWDKNKHNWLLDFGAQRRTPPPPTQGLESPPTPPAGPLRCKGCPIEMVATAVFDNAPSGHNAHTALGPDVVWAVECHRASGIMASPAPRRSTEGTRVGLPPGRRLDPPPSPPPSPPYRALIRPLGEDAMGRSCILDSHPGRGMPAVVQMPACHSRRFKGRGQ